MMTDRYSVNPAGVHCVYINNIFQGDKNSRDTGNDKEEIKRVFEKKLGFTVECHEEKTVPEMKHILDSKKSTELSCLIIIFSSHGEDGCIKGIEKDECPIRLYYKDIDKVLNHEDLKGKPKVLCINACRGNVDGENEHFNAPNTLVIHSCCYGNEANRTSFTGALFIHALCSAFDKNLNVDVSILTNTIQNELYTLNPGQTICCSSSLSKKLIICG